jgi:hypothetical protein
LRGFVDEWIAKWPPGIELQPEISTPFGRLAQIEEPGLRGGEAGGRGGLGALTEMINHEVRLRRAKYLGALADRLFRKECARLGLNPDEAIKSPLLSIITRQVGRVVTPQAQS